MANHRLAEHDDRGATRSQISRIGTGRVTGFIRAASWIFDVTLGTKPKSVVGGDGLEPTTSSV